ncbi:aldo/keto reductase [Nonomuraea sp. NPDC001684]
MMTCLTGCDDRRGPRRLGVPPDVGRQNRDARGPVRQPLRRAAGLSVSRLALGTMISGAETSEPDSHAITDRAQEHGVDFFDTSDVHADGRTEQIIGRRFARGTAGATVPQALWPGWTSCSRHLAPRLRTRTRSVRLVTSSFSPCDV